MVTTKAQAEAGLIVRNPRIHGGEPIIRGTRVPVRSIALARDQDGLERRAIAREFVVDVVAVDAALRYYDAHKAEIDRFIEQHERAAYGV
jgi:uncharacterized protein (DUF433 family)